MVLELGLRWRVLGPTQLRSLRGRVIAFCPRASLRGREGGVLPWHQPLPFIVVPPVLRGDRERLVSGPAGKILMALKLQVSTKPAVSEMLDCRETLVIFRRKPKACRCSHSGTCTHTHIHRSF